MIGIEDFGNNTAHLTEIEYVTVINKIIEKYGQGK